MPAVTHGLANEREPVPSRWKSFAIMVALLPVMLLMLIPVAFFVFNSKTKRT